MQIEHDTPEAIAITDKAARELLVREKLLLACKQYLKAGIHQSTDFQIQSEAYFLARDAIKEAEAL